MAIGSPGSRASKGDDQVTGEDKVGEDVTEETGDGLKAGEAMVAGLVIEGEGGTAGVAGTSLIGTCPFSCDVCCMTW